MAIDFSTYILQLADALGAEDGPALESLLSFSNELSPGKDLCKEFRNASKESIKSYCEGSIESPWDQIAMQYVLVVTSVARKRPGEAFKEQSQLVSLFLRFFSTSSGWTLPALFAMLRELRNLAFDADFHAKYNGQKSECMEEAARVIAKAFRDCMTDRQSPLAESRKWGTYYVVGLVLKCYFRVKRISLSKNILRALDAQSDLPLLSAFPRAHQVTYRYYLGMLNFLNEDYAKAEQELTYAFYHCITTAHANQERILTYLIPLRILRGHLPSRELLQRFPVLDELFAPFIAAIRAGDPSAYDKALDKWERRLVDLNLWLTLDKAREICIRGVFRKTWVVSEKSTRIPISMFHCSLRMSGVDISQEEAECLVANMIYRGYIRGYISHEKQMVVLASTNTFPRLADRPSPYSLL